MNPKEGETRIKASNASISDLTIHAVAEGTDSPPFLELTQRLQTALPDINGLLPIVAQVQEEFFLEKELSEIGKAAEVLEKILIPLCPLPSPGQAVRFINVDADTSSLLKRIIKQDDTLKNQIRKDPKKQALFREPASNKRNQQVSKVPQYDTFINILNIFNGRQNNEIQHVIFPVEKDAEQQKQLERWIEWNSKRAALAMEQERSNDRQTGKQLAAHIHTEPDLADFRRVPLVEANRGSITLSEIEQMPYPPSSENLAKITAYVTGWITETDPTHLQTIRDRQTILQLACNRTNLHESYQESFTDSPLLVTFACWNEHVLTQLLLENAGFDDDIGHLLRALGRDDMRNMIKSLVTVSIQPYLYDPLYDGTNKEEVNQNHLFFAAITEKLHRKDDTRFCDLEDSHTQYFLNTIISRNGALANALNRLGVATPLSAMAAQVRNFERATAWDREEFETAVKKARGEDVFRTIDRRDYVARNIEDLGIKAIEFCQTDNRVRIELREGNVIIFGTYDPQTKMLNLPPSIRKSYHEKLTPLISKYHQIFEYQLLEEIPPIEIFSSRNPVDNATKEYLQKAAELLKQIQEKGIDLQKAIEDRQPNF